MMKYILKEVYDMTCALSDREAAQFDVADSIKVEVEHDNTNDQP